MSTGRTSLGVVVAQAPTIKVSRARDAFPLSNLARILFLTNRYIDDRKTYFLPVVQYLDALLGCVCMCVQIERCPYLCNIKNVKCWAHY